MRLRLCKASLVSGLLFLISYSGYSIQPIQEPSVIKINCGGPQIVYGSDTFLSDRFAINGIPFSNTAITDVLGTTRDDLYITERTAAADLANVSYEIPVTNGDYTVRLHFAEIYWGAPGGGEGGSGSRVFDIYLEDVKELADLDINDEVGAVTALTKDFVITVQDGIIDLDFIPTVNRPKISAIEVFGAGSFTGCFWDELPDTTVTKTEAQSAVVNDKMYVFGGFIEELDVTGATEIYDPQSNNWSSGTLMPVPLTHMGIVTVGTDIWLIGGFVGQHPGTVTNQVQIYDTVNDSWSFGPSLPVAKASGVAAILNNKIHYYGGLLDRDTDTGEHVVLDLNDIPAGWSSLADMPIPRNHLSGVGFNGKLYAIGGHFRHDTNPVEVDVVHEYDPQTDQWQEVAPVPVALSHFEPGTFIYNNEIYIVGGRVDPNNYVNDIYIYNPANDQWRTLCKLPFTMMAPSAKVINDELIVSNGSINNSLFNLSNMAWSYSMGTGGSFSVTLQGSLQGRSDYSGAYDINFYDLGDLSQPKYAYNLTATTQGVITVPDPLDTGTYKVEIIFPKYLIRVVEVVINGDLQIDFGELRAGDANNDNVVALLDFSILASTYNKQEGDTGYNGAADFNNDGAVGLLDFSLLASNFNTSGDTINP